MAVTRRGIRKADTEIRKKAEARNSNEETSPCRFESDFELRFRAVGVVAERAFVAEQVRANAAFDDEGGVDGDWPRAFEVSFSQAQNRHSRLNLKFLPGWL